MNAFDRIKELLAGLTDQELDAIESEIRFTRARRLGPATAEAVGRELAAILAERDARREAARREWDEHVIRCLRLRLTKYREGRLIGMCSCRDCLTGYLTLTPGRMCPMGQADFWEDVNRWRPMVA